MTTGAGPLPRFDLRKRVAYDPDAKHLFYAQARRQLRRLAVLLGFGAPLPR
jgi:hypothetical protein